MFGRDHAVDLALVDGRTVTATPRVDLTGNRRYVLALAGGNGHGVRDRAGNALAAPWSASFTAATDAVAPRLVVMWPPDGRGDVSPLVMPSLRFDESVDPASVEAASVRLTDQHSNTPVSRWSPIRTSAPCAWCPTARSPRASATR